MKFWSEIWPEMTIEDILAETCETAMHFLGEKYDAFRYYNTVNK